MRNRPFIDKPQHPRRLLGSLIALAMLAAGCGSANDNDVADGLGSEPATTQPSSSADTTEPVPLVTSNPDSTETDSASDSEATKPPQQQQGPADYASDAAPSAVGASWTVVERLQFVFGVAANDRLNVRSGPGTANPIIGSFGPAATQITVFDAFELVGSASDGNSSTWAPVSIDGGAGWVNLRFLRPHAANETVTIEGSADDALLSVAANVAEALTSQDLLASMVGDAGLRISVDAYLDDSEDVILTAEDLVSPSDSRIRWGFADGTGDPIDRTIVEQFFKMAGAVAITSTEVISLDKELGTGNIFNNIEEVYPEARVVEYYFGGTEFYAGLDWSSIRFVFDTSSDEPVLLAIVQAEWSI